MNKHVLSLKLPETSCTVDETPTPSRFLKNFSKVPTDFLDGISSEDTSKSVEQNPFAETFRRASVSKPKLQIPNLTTSLLTDENSGSLNTPSITINPATRSPEAANIKELGSLNPSESYGLAPVVTVETTADAYSNDEGRRSELTAQLIDDGSLQESPNCTGPGSKVIPPCRDTVGIEDPHVPSLSNTGLPDLSLEVRYVRVNLAANEVQNHSNDTSQSSANNSSSQSSQVTNSSSQSSSSSSKSSDTNSDEKKKPRGRTPKFLYQGITDKKERHRVRNREAAMRCRERKKMWKSREADGKLFYS